MIMLIIIIIAIVAVIVYFIKNKIHVDFGSFSRRTLPLARGKFGVYCFTGKQGSGKTYSVTKFISHNRRKYTKVYSNITLKSMPYTPINGVAELLSLRDQQNCLIIYDEIFTILSKSSKIQPELMEFLTQQRKMHNVLLTTAQEWLEIPITFRRFVRIQIDCKTIALGKFGGILIETYHDAYNMKWDNMESEYIAPLMSTKISKYERRYMLEYDTFERIRGHHIHKSM